jgi:hypothetical protein
MRLNALYLIAARPRNAIGQTDCILAGFSAETPEVSAAIPELP